MTTMHVETRFCNILRKNQTNALHETTMMLQFDNCYVTQHTAL